MRSTSLALMTALAVAPLISMPAAASDRADVLAVVKQYAAGLNTADKNAIQNLCIPQATIIDDVPPYVFQGATACHDWFDSLLALNNQKGISAEHLAVGRPKRVAVTGDRAYVVTPATLSYKLKGKAVSETGIWTLAFQKPADGWRIAGWSWAQMAQEAPRPGD